MCINGKQNLINIFCAAQVYYLKPYTYMQIELTSQNTEILARYNWYINGFILLSDRMNSREAGSDISLNV